MIFETALLILSTSHPPSASWRHWSWNWWPGCRSSGSWLDLASALLVLVFPGTLLFFVKGQFILKLNFFEFSLRVSSRFTISKGRTTMVQWGCSQHDYWNLSLVAYEYFWYSWHRLPSLSCLCLSFHFGLRS